MKKIMFLIFFGVIIQINSFLYGQDDENCFLYNFEPDTAVIPQATDATKPAEPVSVLVTISRDTLGKVSKYVFGYAIAAWAGAHDDPKLIENIELLTPSLIRFPGGSWSNGYFWNGVPTDVPDSILDGTTYNSSTGAVKKSKFWGQTGVGGWQTTTDQYYALRQNTKVNEGLITINYGYARYGTSAYPVAKAANHAANWVRYDNGRTKFWEIGNENGGPWEYGWIIDTALNHDGQPQVITGELYGKHFKVFVDSMKKAAAEIGATIYIGGQVVIDGPSSWNFVDKTWNEGFFKEVADYADFYVIHNYFSSSATAEGILNYAVTEPQRDALYINQDAVSKGAPVKSLTFTEYNIGMGNVNSKTYVGGMQAVVLICEMIKNNFGLGARWLMLSGSDGMFYGSSDPDSSYNPRPDFYYLSYLEKFVGDHAISANSTNSDIQSYSTRFSSGETAVIIVNKSNNDHVVSVYPDSIGVGEYYYLFSFTGGTDTNGYSKDVFINGNGPSMHHWGPFNDLFEIPAQSYFIEDEIKLNSPARSIQMILIDKGSDLISPKSNLITDNSGVFNLGQNFPNPFSNSTIINYELLKGSYVNLKVIDSLGREIATLVRQYQDAGNHSVQFDTSNLAGGIYFYSIEIAQYQSVKKMIIIK